MLTRLFNRNQKQDDVPQHIYGRVVAQARLPHFYQAWGIPDTPIGRFELLSLHMFVLSHRFSQEENDIASALSQEVFDAFVSDLDRALRQLGIGDTSVPKRKKRMIATFYTQVDQLSEPLTAEDTATISASPMISGIAGMEDHPAAGPLAEYVVYAKRRLTGQSVEELITDGPDWPEPGANQ